MHSQPCAEQGSSAAASLLLLFLSSVAGVEFQILAWKRKQEQNRLVKRCCKSTIKACKTLSDNLLGEVAIKIVPLGILATVT